MSIHRFEPVESHPIGESPLDEREWQLQERALQEERAGAASGDEPALADYRRVVRALCTPLPADLPADFAVRVAARAARRRRLQSRLEDVLTQLLLAALGIAGGVVAVQSGGAWLQDATALVPRQVLGLGLPWGLAILACLGLSWSMEHWRRGASPHR
jgi:hypothetical protein